MNSDTKNKIYSTYFVYVLNISLIILATIFNIPTANDILVWFVGIVYGLALIGLFFIGVQDIKLSLIHRIMNIAITFITFIYLIYVGYIVVPVMMILFTVFYLASELED